MTRYPPPAPGTAPFTTRVLLSASTRTTLTLRSGDAVGAHVTARPHALEDARREGRGADGAGSAVEHRAVGGGAAAEVVTLHDALEALALADAHDGDRVSGREERNRDLVAHLHLGPGLDLELTQHAGREAVPAFSK